MGTVEVVAQTELERQTPCCMYLYLCTFYIRELLIHDDDDD